MSRPTYRAGGEVVCWCTKCKLDRLHVIIAMVGDEPKRVECLACHSQHNYRAPKVERPAREPVLRSPSRVVSPRSPAAPRGAAARIAEEVRQERAARSLWERSIAGQPATAFRPYEPTSVLEAGQLVRHAKFGDGVVHRVIDRTKVEIIFQDGPKTMAHAMA